MCWGRVQPSKAERVAVAAVAVVVVVVAVAVVRAATGPGRNWIRLNGIKRSTQQKTLH